MMTKRVNFISNLFQFRLNEALKTFIQRHISTIISAAAEEGPDEMTCFPAGLYYLLTFRTRMSKITQKSVCFYAKFSKK